MLDALLDAPRRTSRYQRRLDATTGVDDSEISLMWAKFAGMGYREILAREHAVEIYSKSEKRPVSCSNWRPAGRRHEEALVSRTVPWLKVP
jgi:hypothetical protein